MYAAWILAIIMVMSGVLCTQAETVSTGKAHGSKVNTTGGDHSDRSRKAV